MPTLWCMALKGEALTGLQAQLDGGWHVVNEHHLEKTYKFKDFREALAKATEAGYAELDDTVAVYRSIGGPPNIPADRVKYLRDLLWKTMNDDDFQAWSKKAKRDISPMTGEETEKALTKVLNQYDKFKPLLEKYVK